MPEDRNTPHHASLISCQPRCVFWGAVGTAHTAWSILYLAFLAVVVVWMLIKYAEDDHPRWIVFTGLLCSLSIALKITGLYTLAAAGLAITFSGLPQPRRQPHRERRAGLNGSTAAPSQPWRSLPGRCWWQRIRRWTRSPTLPRP
jgi:hypothetical protein